MTFLLLCFGLWTIAAFFFPNVFKFSNNFQDSHSLNFGVCVFVKAAYENPGISKLIKMLVSCNGVCKIFFSQAYNRLTEIYIYFNLEFF